MPLRYINPRFTYIHTYILTYLLTYSNCHWTTSSNVLTFCALKNSMKPCEHWAGWEVWGHTKRALYFRLNWFCASLRVCVSTTLSWRGSNCNAPWGNRSLCNLYKLVPLWLDVICCRFCYVLVSVKSDKLCHVMLGYYNLQRSCSYSPAVPRKLYAYRSWLHVIK